MVVVVMTLTIVVVVLVDYKDGDERWIKESMRKRNGIDTGDESGDGGVEVGTGDINGSNGSFWRL